MARDRYESGREAPAVTFLKRGVPIVLLILVLLRVGTIYSDYQRNVSDEDDGIVSEETTPSVEPTPTAGGTDEAIAGDEGDEVDTPGGSGEILIVRIDRLNFRAGPSDSAEILKSLSEGTRLTWLETKNGWYRVEDPDGVRGWVIAREQYLSPEE
jgi:uncharacterized protein YgiM (DUF1202 family)